MFYSKVVDTLNPQQKQAAQASDGPVVIIAGPGTGKTKTLTARLGFLVTNGVAPAKILALTFTKKAAEEMQQRYLANNPAGPVILTFHALCFGLVKDKLGAAPVVIAEHARLAIIKNLSKPAQLKTASTRELSLLISRAKNMANAETAVQRLVVAYNTELATMGMCDFDDILLQVRDLLRSDSAWRTQQQQRFSHILVDEFQDTSVVQYQLLQLLRGTDNLFVIGDPQQSIYGFRGADGDIFAKFAADFPQARQITLSVNYRSAPQIVALANAVYPTALPLVAYNQQPGAVQAVAVLNEYSEANWVLDHIQKLIGGSDMLRVVSDDHRHNHCSLGDIAVLYRSRRVARTVQKTLIDSGIPVQIVGEGSPYDAPDVQLIVQLLTNLADPQRPAVIKGLSRGQIAALLGTLDASLSPYQLAEQIMQHAAMQPTDHTRQLLAVLVQHKTLAAAVKYFDQLAAQDFYDPRADAITLLTIHAAKGLEFAHVFVVGVEQGVLPAKSGDEAEEKRLFYVAITRAKERLDLLYTRLRGGQKADISDYITQLDPSVLPRVIDPLLQGDQRRAQKRKAKRAQTSLF